MTSSSLLNHISPAAVGIPSRDVHVLLEALEASGTEMHGMIILRHGLVAAEGHWAPFCAGQVHGSQSLTKTMTGSAFGVAMLEGLMTLDTKLTDIFPEYAHHCAGKPYWDELRMRHLTTMSAGMEKQPAVTDVQWIEKFFTMDIVHKPGTAFYYNSAACSMVGACIRRLTGLGLREYLRDRLLRPIGIDADSIKWHCHPDGMENGSGGLVSTTEDNARLMELYRQRGNWHGRQLLSKEWIDFALAAQNENLPAPLAYCGMMWKREECFMADGAMGQWSMLFPEKDVIVSLNQTISNSAQGEAVLKAVFSFARGLSDTAVDEEEHAAQLLGERLKRLALKAPECQRSQKLLSRLSGKGYTITQGKVRFFADDLAIFQQSFSISVLGFRFDVHDGNLLVTVKMDEGSVVCPCGLKGQRLITTVDTRNPAKTLALSGFMPDDDTLCMEIRWLESCRVHRLTFRFLDSGAEILSHMDAVGGFDVPDEIARAAEEGGANA